MIKPKIKKIQIIENGKLINLELSQLGIGPIQNKYGNFIMYSFSISDEWQKYSVLIKPNKIKENFYPIFDDDILQIRTDSGCETGQLFCDNSCECSEQLLEMMNRLGKSSSGIIIHIPNQDGRGMGIGFKLATLYLQRELGLNTIESAAYLSQDGIIDKRTYGGVVAILKFLGIKNDKLIVLNTNNPDKIKIFEENGFNVKLSQIEIDATDQTKKHLKAKQKYLGHDIGKDYDM